MLNMPRDFVAGLAGAMAGATALAAGAENMDERAGVVAGTGLGSLGLTNLMAGVLRLKPAKDCIGAGVGAEGVGATYTGARPCPVRFLRF
jgi:hypothetical protein